MLFRHKFACTFMAVLATALLTTAASAQFVITTVAGGGTYAFPRHTIPALEAPLGKIEKVAADAAGNIYAIDNSNHLILKITPEGSLTVVAGNGSLGLADEGVPATSTSLGNLTAIAADGPGNLYLAESLPSGIFRILKVSPDGTIDVLAGGGLGGDGSPAVGAFIIGVGDLFADLKGNLYISDANRIRKVDTQGIITTVAGNGNCCGNAGDNVPAVSIPLDHPGGVFVDPAGRIYIADTYKGRIRRVGTDGIITTMAGTIRGYSGDGGPATQAALNWPNDLAVDEDGTIFIADGGNQRIRVVSRDGIIRTLAGTGEENFTGDGGPASAASLRNPTDIALGRGGLFVADSGNSRIRFISTGARPFDPRVGTPIISTFAGNNNFMFAGEGLQATEAFLNLSPDPFLAWPYALGTPHVNFDSQGNLYISDTANHRVRKVAPNGVITTFAGRGGPGYAGDGGPGIEALLERPAGLAVDAEGNVYIADVTRVRKVDTAGIITTIAGGQGIIGCGGCGDDYGDGGPATSARFNSISDIDLDRFGNIYIADKRARRLRRITPDGIINTEDTFGLSQPSAVTVGPDDSVYIAVEEGGKDYIRHIARNGTRSAVVSGLYGAGKVAVDQEGAIYMTYGTCLGCSDHTVKKVVDGVATLFAGTGEAGFAGDGGPASAAMMNSPSAVRFDKAGNLYVVDAGNNRIRKIHMNPATGLPEPSMTQHLQPGFHIAAVTLGDGEHEGYWGLEILASKGALAGGFNLGGGVQKFSLPPAFGAFYLPYKQNVTLQLNAQVLPGGDAAQMGMVVRVLDAQRRQIDGEHRGTTSMRFEQELEEGFYIIEVRGAENAPRAAFQLALNADVFAGGADTGGFINAGIVGFGAFYITEEQDVTIRVFGMPTYKADGAGAMRLQLFDAERKLLRTVP